MEGEGTGGEGVKEGKGREGGKNGAAVQFLA